MSQVHPPNRKKSRLALLLTALTGFSSKAFAFVTASVEAMLITSVVAFVLTIVVVTAIKNIFSSGSKHIVQAVDQNVSIATSDKQLREVIRRLGGDPNDNELARKIHDEAIAPNKEPVAKRRNPNVDLNDPNIQQDIKGVIEKHRSSFVSSQKVAEPIGDNSLAGTWKVVSETGNGEDVGGILSGIRRGDNIGRQFTLVSKGPGMYGFGGDKSAKPLPNNQKNPGTFVFEFKTSISTDRTVYSLRGGKLIGDRNISASNGIGGGYKAHITSVLERVFLASDNSSSGSKHDVKDSNSGDAGGSKGKPPSP